MLNIKLIRNEPDKVKEGLASRGIDPSIVDDVLELDKEVRRLKTERDKLRHERKIASREYHEGHKEDLIDDGWRN